MYERIDGRGAGALREVRIVPGFVRTAAGSCLVECGGTRVICTASVQEGVPPFLRGKGQGWLTAEYAMLPASTGQRKARDGVKKDGRSVEIQRLIGRSLRQAVDLARLGERTVTLDCDVLEADGGTRTASITGSFVALVLAVDKLIREGRLLQSPVTHQVSAVSCGIVSGQPLLDLCYVEDSCAQVDMNVVMDDAGRFIEVQGTGEGRSFSREELDRLLALAEEGNAELMRAQRDALGGAARHIGAKELLIVATGNANKLREFKEILGARYDVVSMKDVGVDADIEETGTTFEENAAIKAEYVMKQTGCAAIADDSGLAVDALDGAPGVYSARYCGRHGDDEANNRLLLENLKDVPAPRTGRYIAAIALSRPGKRTLIRRGTCEGEVLFEAHGAGGFGYDPLFRCETGETFAEISAEEKNRISHRRRGIEAVLKALEEE